MEMTNDSSNKDMGLLIALMGAVNRYCLKLKVAKPNQLNVIMVTTPE